MTAYLLASITFPVCLLYVSVGYSLFTAVLKFARM